MSQQARPYLGKYNIMLCTSDDSVTYLFINVCELAIWIYKEPSRKELNNVQVRIGRIKKNKAANRNIRCCIIIDSVKYNVYFVRAN